MAVKKTGLRIRWKGFGVYDEDLKILQREPLAFFDNELAGCKRIIRCQASKSNGEPEDSQYSHC